MSMKKNLLNLLLLSSVSLSTIPSAFAGKIEYIEGRDGNDYYKYPKICTVKKHVNETEYGFDTFCGKNQDFASYKVQYTSSYGDDYSKIVETGMDHYHHVNILPGDDPFIQTDLVITPIILDDW